MIDVINEKFKIIGYIDGKEYLNKKKKRIGLFDVDQNVVRDKHDYILLSIDESGIIRYNDEMEVGNMREGKIYSYDGFMLYELQKRKEKGEILRHRKEIALILEGNLEDIGDLDFFGICTIYLELFS